MSRGDALYRVLSALHEAAFDDASWPEASALIDQACGIKGNMLTFARGQSRDNVEIYLAPLYYRGERHHERERAYFDLYYPQDERIPRLICLPDSKVVRVTDLYTEDELKTSAAFNESLPIAQFQNGLNMRMDGPNGSRITWSAADPVDGESWSFDQIDTIERLLPHLRQYVRIRQVLADVDGLKASLAALLDYSATGVIQLNRRGRIVAANDRAREILNRQDCLYDPGGFLCAHAPADNDRLRELLARALPNSGSPGAAGSMVLTRRSGLSRPVLHVTPIGHREGDVPAWEVAALGLVVDPYSQLPVDRALVEAALELSPAESRVAVLLAEGKTVRDVAVESGRSVNTVRWHIRRIFERQGLTRLGQLVALVRSLAGHSGSGP